MAAKPRDLQSPNKHGGLARYICKSRRHVSGDSAASPLEGASSISWIGALSSMSRHL